MEIEFTPLEIVDERILGGNQSAYQIDSVSGSCYRSQIWADHKDSLGSTLGWKLGMMIDQQMGMETEGCRLKEVEGKANIERKLVLRFLYI